MDFLDSISDEDFTLKRRSLRVRSWYLYEQYRELQRSQTAATEQLQDKVQQDRYLLKELEERRARRSLCSSVSREDLHAIRSSVFSGSNSEDNFYETFYQLQDDELLSFGSDKEAEGSIQKELSELNSICAEGNEIGEFFSEGDGPEVGTPASALALNVSVISGDGETTLSFNTPDNIKEDETKESLSEDGERPGVEARTGATVLDISITSEEAESYSMPDNVKDELELVKKTIEHNLILQLGTVKEHQQCLKEFSKMCDGVALTGVPMKNDPSRAATPELLTLGADTTSTSKYEEAEEFMEESDVCLIDSCEDDARDDEEYYPFSLWSRLVSFAYQLVQLNHGNCYYDYSSQLLTAVLAFDVLRRGLNRMCKELTISNHIKQSRR